MICRKKNKGGGGGWGGGTEHPITIKIFAHQVNAKAISSTLGQERAPDWVEFSTWCARLKMTCNARA